MESVVVDTINSPSGSSSSDAWQLMLNHLGDDTSGERLKLHLAMFGDLCRSVKPKPLRRLKTFLRSTVTQKRLNHVGLLRIHREQAELIDLKYIYNNFIGQNQIRSAAFAPFE
jgi:hypothetical protein